MLWDRFVTYMKTHIKNPTIVPLNPGIHEPYLRFSRQDNNVGCLARVRSSIHNCLLDTGFKYFSCSTLFWEMIQFDLYFFQ